MNGQLKIKSRLFYMNKKSVLIILLCATCLAVIFQRISYLDLLRKDEVMVGNYPTVFSKYNRIANDDTPITLKTEACKKLLYQYRNISLNDKFLQVLAEVCSVSGQDRTESIIDKQYLDGALRNVSCSTAKPKYLNQSGPYVALASYPGSGNTWTRVLLESITGVYTGSLYEDKMAHFPGSKHCPTKVGVTVLKTHMSSNQVVRPGCPNAVFSRSIFILRNPYDAIIADFNRINGGKVGIADRNSFNGSRWANFVKNHSYGWREMTLYWMSTYNRPVYVLVYEDLKASTMLEMYKIMEFLNLNVTLQSLYCLVKRPHEDYYRAVKPDWLTKTKLFNSEMKKRLNSIIKDVHVKVFKSSRKADILKSYILSNV